jgi:hypothetical protein
MSPCRPVHIDTAIRRGQESDLENLDRVHGQSAASTVQRSWRYACPLQQLLDDGDILPPVVPG